MGLFDALNISTLGMAAQQTGLQVTGNNIANVSTPGYTRQEIVLGSLSHPGGVQVLDVRGARDALLGNRLDSAASRRGAADATVAGAQDLEQLLGDLGDTGLGAALSRFFSSWQTLSAAPGDLNARYAVVSASGGLATSVRTAAQGLVDKGLAANSQISSDLDKANGLIDQIAGLDRQILQAETGTGQTANELRDQRATAQRDLATVVGSSAGEASNGDFTVTVGGLTVVQGGVAHHLQAVPNAATGYVDVGLSGTSQGLINDRLGGSVGANLTLRDTTIPALQTRLDDFASSLVSAVNVAHAAGYGLDGVNGRDLFQPAAGGPGTAAALTLDATVAADPRRLAASQTLAGLPGDNQVAVAIAGLQTKLVASGGTATLAQAIAAIQSDVGTASQAAQTEQTAATTSQQYLSDLRESESGVSLEEQMGLLTRYQRAYQASAKVISTISDMLDTLVNM